MDGFHHHQPPHNRPIAPPLAGDHPPPPPPHQHQQSPLFYQQNYIHHHHQPPYPPTPQQQWDHQQQQHHHPPIPPPPMYNNHPPNLQYPPIAPRYLNPNPSAYPPPNQAWGNSSWVQNRGLEYQGMTIPYNNEEDWAARARAWASANSVTENHHKPPDFTPIGRLDEHNYAYHNRYQESVGVQPFPRSSNQLLPGLQKQDHHNFTNGHPHYNAEDKSVDSSIGHLASPQRSFGPSSSVYEPEVPYSYSSAPGSGEPVVHRESSHNVEPFIHSQPTLPLRNISMEQQPSFTHGLESTKPLTDACDLPLNFEPRPAYEHETHHNISYGHADPSLSNATSIHAWNSQIPFAPSEAQFETAFAPQPFRPVQVTPIFGRIPGPNFGPSIPPISSPFGLGSGPSVHHAAAFPGDGNGVFNLSERPKKVAVPNWLREEIIKTKPAIASAVPTHHDGSPFNSIGSEDADKSFRTSDQADNKSIDSAKSTEDQEDNEDDSEAVQSAAINQEIKRVLTEVLLKVTDDLFDEIAAKVINEDDFSVEVVESSITENSKLPPSPAIAAPKASSKVIVGVKKNYNNSDSATKNSSPNSPGGNALGLVNYASDDDDETESPTLPSSGMITSQETDDKPSEDALEEMEKGHALVITREPSQGPRDTENSCMPETAVKFINETPLQSAKALLKPKDTQMEPSIKSTNNGTEPVLSPRRTPDKRSVSRDKIEGVKADARKAGHKTSDGSGSVIHDDRNRFKRKMDERDNTRERLGDIGISRHDSAKDDRKEASKETREKHHMVDERKSDRFARVAKDSEGYNQKHSSSPSSRGRKSKENSSSSYVSASSDEPSKKLKKRDSFSPFPTRSSKRKVSRSPPSKHSHRRNSPYSSTERRRRSRSRTPPRHRPVHKR